MNVDSKKTLAVQSKIDAPVERVFDAWLDLDTARQFLFATPEGEMVRAELDPRVGGRFLFVDLRAGIEIVHVGEYRVIDRPKCLAFSFAVPQFSEEFADVEIEFVPDGEGCTVTLTHRDAPSDWAESSREGWEQILESLAKVVATP